MTEAKPRSVGWVRWVICLLPFFAIVLSYLDRLVLAVLKGPLSHQFQWTEINYGHISVAFSGAYALGLAGAGYVLDRIGVRRGFLIAAILWGIFDAAHGLLGYLPLMGMWSVAAFCAGRVGLGLSEGAFFPASVKVVAEWFPKRNRALATGIFNAGSNVGAILAPLLTPWIKAHYGWPAAFFFLGGLALLWALAWRLIYRQPEEHRLLSGPELAYIRSDHDAPAAKMPWRQVLGYRQTWSFMVGKFLTDPIWWLYLFWVPAFLHSEHGLNLSEFGPPLVVIYLMADIGSIGGGWLSSALIHRGQSVNRGRKTAMLVCALCVTPIIAAAYAANVWLATVLIGLAAAAHQGWSANLFTMASDTAPRSAISSTVGLGGMAGGIGGMLFADFIGHHLAAGHGRIYLIPFCIAAAAYLLALLLIQILNPRLDPITAPRPAAGAAASG